MDKFIKIACEGAKTLPLSRLHEFQGELKSLSRNNYEKLRNEIVLTGFSFPVHVWADPKSGKHFIIDGHQRLRTVRQMIEHEGFTCGEIPIVLVHAATKEEAKNRVLQATSQYGKITDQGLYEFMAEFEMPPEDLQRFDLPGIDNTIFLQNFFEEPPPVGDQPNPDGSMTETNSSLDKRVHEENYHAPGLNEVESQDDAPEVKKEIFVRKGDVFVMGKHRLLCGDSASELDLNLLMDGCKAELLLTDPPYGVSYAEKNRFLNAIAKGNAVQEPIENDNMDPKEMNSFWLSVLKNAHRVSSDQASYYIFSPQGGDLMMMMMSIIDAGWQLKHMLIWVKNNHVLGRADYNYRHEPILYGWKKDGTHKFAGKGNCKTSVWEFAKPLKNDLHPTMKPVSICEEAVLNSSDQFGNVLDLFGGSGSTLIACEKTQRACFMMEIDPGYCQVILDRWATFSGKDPLRLGDNKRWSEIKSVV